MTIIFFVLEQNKYNAEQCPTSGITNKGFSGMQWFAVRFYISCNLTENRLQSLTGYTAGPLAPIENQAITLK